MENKRGGLVISRRPEERIMIGDDICITLVRLKGGKAVLHIIAPPDVPVDREELYRAKLRLDANAANAVAGNDRATCEPEILDDSYQDDLLEARRWLRESK